MAMISLVFLGRRAAARSAVPRLGSLRAHAGPLGLAKLPQATRARACSFCANGQAFETCYPFADVIW
jgi:hypothetical protein